jgi:hypothetical protein
VYADVRCRYMAAYTSTQRQLHAYMVTYVAVEHDDVLSVQRQDRGG